MSYLDKSEVEAIQKLDRKTPYLIQGVSTSIFSVSRYYGGATYNGASYTYIPATDELIRDDVLKLVKKLRRKKK